MPSPIAKQVDIRQPCRAARKEEEQTTGRSTTPFTHPEGVDFSVQLLDSKGNTLMSRLQDYTLNFAVIRGYSQLQALRGGHGL